MKTAKLLAIGMVCLLPGAAAWAQHGEQLSDSYSLAAARTDPQWSAQHHQYSTVGHQWVGELEKAGVVDRSLHGPYRVAVPLIMFGEGGPALKLTYARSLPGSSGSSGPLLFINIPLP